MGAVLITRPEPAARETAAAVEAMGLRAIVAPFLDVERIEVLLPGRVTACLVTSANAVWAIPGGVPVYAVGDATATRAREVTAAPVFSAAGDAVALAALVARSCDPTGGPLLVLSGERQGQVLAEDLRARGFRVIRRVVYRAKAAAVFPVVAAEAIAAGEVDMVLFYSAETARAFVRLLPAGLAGGLAQMRAVVLSPAIGGVVAGLQWKSVECAGHPSQDALLRLI